MQLTPSDYNSLVAYYCAYLGACASVIFWLSKILHSAGRVFLTDAFTGNQTLVLAVSRLLDIGFCLVSFGYVALTYHTSWRENNFESLATIASMKIGGFLLVLGVAHIFNLLLLALFRQRRAPGSTPAAGA